MNNKSYENLGEMVTIISPKDALKILRIFSSGTRVYKIPKIISELLNSNYEIACQAVKAVPFTYFYLSSDLKENKYLKKAAIKSFQRQKKYSHYEYKIRKNEVK